MRLRRLVVTNIGLLLERRYPARKFSTPSAQQQAFAKDAGITWSSVQRRLDPENGVTLDVLADIAVAFHVLPHELLLPEMLESLAPPPKEDGDRETQFHRNAG